MFRHILFAGAVFACIAAVLTGCSKKENAPEPKEGENLTAPAGATLRFAEGFGGDLSNWAAEYMVTMWDIYPHMRITTESAHTGTHSLTTDSNVTALLYNINPRVESGIVGVQFYIMAKALGQANFTVELGQNAGSSGGVSTAIGLGFDPTDSIKCTFYDTYYPQNNGRNDSMLAPIQLDHWYKCAVEADFSDSTISYYLEDALVRTFPLPASVMGIDRVLIFRGLSGTYDYAPSQEGTKQYYADDIVLYTK